MVLCCCHEKALRGNAPDGSDFKCVPKKPSRYTTERAFIYPSPCTGSVVRRTEEAFPSSRFRSPISACNPASAGKVPPPYGFRSFLFVYESPSRILPRSARSAIYSNSRHTLILDGEFIFGACTSIVYRASLIK